MYRTVNGGGLVACQLVRERRTYPNYARDQLCLIILGLCRTEPQPTWKLGNATGSLCNHVSERARGVLKELVELGYLTVVRRKSRGFGQSVKYQTTPQGLAYLDSLDLAKVVPEIKPKPKKSRCRCGTFKTAEASICKKCTRRLEKLSKALAVEFTQAIQTSNIPLPQP